MDKNFKKEKEMSFAKFVWVMLTGPRRIFYGGVIQFVLLMPITPAPSTAITAFLMWVERDTVTHLWTLGDWLNSIFVITPD